MARTRSNSNSSSFFLRSVATLIVVVLNVLPSATAFLLAQAILHHLDVTVDFTAELCWTAAALTYVRNVAVKGRPMCNDIIRLLQGNIFNTQRQREPRCSFVLTRILQVNGFLIGLLYAFLNSVSGYYGLKDMFNLPWLSFVGAICGFIADLVFNVPLVANGLSAFVNGFCESGGAVDDIESGPDDRTPGVGVSYIQDGLRCDPRGASRTLSDTHAGNVQEPAPGPKTHLLSLPPASGPARPGTR